MYNLFFIFFLVLHPNSLAACRNSVLVLECLWSLSWGQDMTFTAKLYLLHLPFLHPQWWFPSACKFGLVVLPWSCWSESLSSLISGSAHRCQSPLVGTRGGIVHFMLNESTSHYCTIDCNPWFQSLYVHLLRAIASAVHSCLAALCGIRNAAA